MADLKNPSNIEVRLQTKKLEVKALKSELKKANKEIKRLKDENWELFHQLKEARNSLETCQTAAEVLSARVKELEDKIPPEPTKEEPTKAPPKPLKPKGAVIIGDKVIIHEWKEDNHSNCPMKSIELLEDPDYSLIVKRAQSDS
jgi:cell division septum initiation protein DivIVA